MKLAAFLATILVAFACLGFVTASPKLTPLNANPKWMLLRRGTQPFGESPNALNDRPETRAHGQQTPPSGDPTSHVNVVGAPSVDFQNSGKKRVHREGSTRHPWAQTSRATRRRAKYRRKTPHTKKGSQALLFWDPEDSYRTQPKRRQYWERNCHEALAREGCEVALIHQGEAQLTRNGQKVAYINVQAASLADMEKTKDLHVFQDGSSSLGWSLRDQKRMREAKRLSAYQSVGGAQPLEGLSQTALSWEPPHAYKGTKKRKLFWEQRCEVALAEAGCRVGIIHQGETKGAKPNGEKANYIRVEGAPSVGMAYGTRMRVYHDGTYDVLDDWSARERTLMTKAKRQAQRRPDRRRIRTTSLVEESVGSQAPSSTEYNEDSLNDKRRLEATIRTQTPAQDPAHDDPEHRISWDPPNAYEKSPYMKGLWMQACHQALKREGCDLARIYQGYKRLKTSDGKRSRYVDVSAGKKDDPSNTHFMQLFEDGNSRWYPPGPYSRSIGGQQGTSQSRKSVEDDSK